MLRENAFGTEETRTRKIADRGASVVPIAKGTRTRAGAPAARFPSASDPKLGDNNSTGGGGGGPPPDVPPLLDPRGVFVPRVRKKPGANLIDPRQPIWEDEVGAMRRALMSGEGSIRKAAIESAKKTQLSAAIYRYSKGPDFVNDELGYGEVIHECMWQIDEDGYATELSRTSQRTKTGRQRLKATKPNE